MRKSIFIIIVCLVILLTGCWDKVEINKKVFVLTIGIDKLEEEIDSKESNIFQNIEPDRYSIGYVYPNTGLFAGKTQGEPKNIMKATGINMADIQENMSTRLGGSTTFDHTKIIVLGEEVLKDGEMVREVLDYIERSPRVGRRIHLMATQGKAEEVINTEVPHQPPLVGLYIRDLINKPTKGARVADADLGYILRSMHESNVAIIPRIQSLGEEVEVSGVGVLKDYGLVGWMEEEETTTLMLMMNKVKNLTSSIKFNDKTISGEVTSANTEMNVSKSDNKIIVAFDIEMEGNLKQHLFMVKKEPLDEKYLNKVEKELEKLIEQMVIKVYKRLQDEFGADILQVGEHIRKYNPDLWESVKDNWDEVFLQTEIEVTIDLKVRRTGVTK